MTTLVTEPVAKTDCQNMGGILAPVSNSNEQACVDCTFDLGAIFWFLALSGTDDVWIGIERVPTCMMQSDNCFYAINSNPPVRRH